MKLKNILGIDIGFGDIKVTFGTSDGNIIKQWKFPSAIGVTKRNEHVSDNRIYDYKEHSYYVGENAAHLPSDNRIDIADYKNLEYYAPLFIYHVLKEVEHPDIIIAGLSKAQINNSGHFKEAIEKFTVNGTDYTFDEVYILPQGAGAKITIDKYGNHFPKEQDEFLGKTTYVGCDVGFNTLDMFMVTDGKTSPALFEGIEKEGVMKIATLVAIKVKELHNRSIGLHEAKQIIDTGVYKLRGQSHDFKAYVDEVKKTYLKDLLQLIEVKYGKVLDQCDFISVTGGGSALFKTTDNGFIRTPLSHHAFYNSIGQFEWGCKKA
jgi:hypothetical protein